MAQHRKGTLTNARARAKAALQRMPLGSVVMIGQWLDTGEYAAKTGSAMSWAHERFRPVEQWASAPKARGTGRKLIKLEIKSGTRRNPGRQDPAVRMAIADATKILGRVPRNVRGRR